MSNQKYIVGIVALALILITVIVITSMLKDNTQQTIDVTGSYTVKAQPDYVILNFAAETIAESAEQAQEKNAKIVSDLKNNLKIAGLDESAVETVSFNIYPNYDYGPDYQSQPKITGYTASHMFELKLEDVSTSGQYLDIIIKSGINRINNIRFEITEEKQNQLRIESFSKATENARSKADAIAQGLGKEVGNVVKVSDQTFDFQPYYLRGGADFAVAEAKTALTEITPSDIEVRASIAATFALK